MAMGSCDFLYMHLSQYIQPSDVNFCLDTMLPRKDCCIRKWDDARKARTRRARPWPCRRQLSFLHVPFKCSLFEVLSCMS